MIDLFKCLEILIENSIDFSHKVNTTSKYSNTLLIYSNIFKK